MKNEPLFLWLFSSRSCPGTTRVSANTRSEARAEVKRITGKPIDQLHTLEPAEQLRPYSTAPRVAKPKPAPTASTGGTVSRKQRRINNNAFGIGQTFRGHAPAPTTPRGIKRQIRLAKRRAESRR